MYTPVKPSFIGDRKGSDPEFYYVKRCSRVCKLHERVSMLTILTSISISEHKPMIVL